MTRYLKQTRTATYGFWAAMPLLIAYEWLIIIANNHASISVRVGADVWIKRMLGSLGVRGHLILGALVATIGLIIFFRERKQNIELKGAYFIGILAESIVYAIVVTMVITTMINRLFIPAIAPMLAAGQGGITTMTHLALSIGAGLYEELLFRVLIFGAIFLVLDRLTAKRVPAICVATLISALLFSAAHHVGSLGDDWTAPVFLYRFLYGIALQLLYLGRGFGVAAWTHALYDIMVVLIKGEL